MIGVIDHTSRPGVSAAAAANFKVMRAAKNESRFRWRGLNVHAKWTRM